MSFTPDMHYELMVRAAYYYYECEYTQTKIAEMLGISRLTLGRILKEAKDTGVVKIEITDSRNLTSMIELESGLCRRFNLRSAIVADCLSDSGRDRSRAIAAAAAGYIARSMRSGMKVSIGWGRTMNMMVDGLTSDRAVKDIEVMTLMGGGGTTDTTIQPGMLAGNFLHRYSGNGYVINAPFFCSSADVCAQLREEASVKDIIARCFESDMALVGIGEQPSFDESYWARYSYGDETLQKIIDAGAVGDICGNYFDVDGRPCCPEINRRLVGVTLPDVQKLSHVVALAGGDDKIAAVRAALNGGYVNVLITDRYTAKAVLA